MLNPSTKHKGGNTITHSNFLPLCLAELSVLLFGYLLICFITHALFIFSVRAISLFIQRAIKYFRGYLGMLSLGHLTSARPRITDATISFNLRLPSHPRPALLTIIPPYAHNSPRLGRARKPSTCAHSRGYSCNPQRHPFPHNKHPR